MRFSHPIEITIKFGLDKKDSVTFLAAEAQLKGSDNHFILIGNFLDDGEQHDGTRKTS